MKITYRKVDWVPHLYSKKCTQSTSDPYNMVELSSNHIYCATHDLLRLKRLHFRDIQILISSLAQQETAQSKITAKNISKMPRNAFKTKTPQNAFKTNKDQKEKPSRPKSPQNYQNLKNSSQSTLSTKQTKITNKIIVGQPKIQHPNSNQLMSENVKMPIEFTFASKDSSINMTYNQIQLDCQSCLSLSESKFSQGDLEDSSEYSNIDFLKDHGLASESEEEWNPDTMFKKVRISEYLKKETKDHEG